MERKLEITVRNAPVFLSAIVADADIQPRVELDDSLIADYAEAMRQKADFPPVVVFREKEVYWLADGFHRVAAANRNHYKSIEAQIRKGTNRDAKLFAAGANSAHGLRRTNADKHRAVTKLLNDTEWAKWSDREIARKCAVSPGFVDQLRKSSLPTVGSEPPAPRTYTTKHATIATMNVANIGHREPEAEVPEPDDPEREKRNQERMERHRREQARDQEIRSRIIKTSSSSLRLNNETADEYIARWRQARKEEKEAEAEIRKLDRAESQAREISELRNKWPNHRVGPKGVRFTCPDCGKSRWAEYQQREEPELCSPCRERRLAVRAFPGHKVSEKGQVEFTCKKCGESYWLDFWYHGDGTPSLGKNYRRADLDHCSDYCAWVAGLKGKPSWNRQEWKKIMAVKKAARDGDRWGGWGSFAGLFEEAAKHKAKDFNLGDPQHDADQEALFRALVEYFEDFEDPNRRLNAIHNVVRKLKPLANDCHVEIHELPGESGDGNHSGKAVPSDAKPNGVAVYQ